MRRARHGFMNAPNRDSGSRVHESASLPSDPTSRLKEIKAGERSDLEIPRRAVECRGAADQEIVSSVAPGGLVGSAAKDYANASVTECRGRGADSGPVNVSDGHRDAATETRVVGR